MNTDQMIFVFGSNLRGAHGLGAAKFAREHKGAMPGIGHGFQGKSYAIPTKDVTINTLGKAHIKVYVDIFIQFARNVPELQFQVTQIGCGLAGYTPEDIAPMFKSAPSNCYFDRAWSQVFNSLDVNKQYWN